MDTAESRQYRQLLQASQRIEAVATAVYGALARRPRNAEMRDLMRRLAEDEAEHAREVAVLLRGREWPEAILLAVQHGIGVMVGVYLSWRREDVVLLTLLQFEVGGTRTYRDMLALKCLFQNERNSIDRIATTEEEHSVLLRSGLDRWRNSTGC